jgi:hypothetical protein
LTRSASTITPEISCPARVRWKKSRSSDSRWRYSLVRRSRTSPSCTATESWLAAYCITFFTTSASSRIRTKRAAASRGARPATSGPRNRSVPRSSIVPCPARAPAVPNRALSRGTRITTVTPSSNEASNVASSPRRRSPQYGFAAPRSRHAVRSAMLRS